MVTLGTDPRGIEDAVPSDLLAPSGVPRWVLVQCSDGEGETHSVAALPFAGSLAAVTNPVGE